MARPPRLCPAGIPLHLVQRGHNRQPCFAATPHDFATYAGYLAKAAQRFDVQIHAWVLMTNHVHILATPSRDKAMSQMMHLLNRNYVSYFNALYQRSGTLWEGRFKCSLVESVRYLLQCYRYIEMNPVRANLVDDPADYRWSSYRCNALGVHSQLITPHAEYLQLGSLTSVRLAAYRELFREQLDPQVLQEIRDNTNRNLAIGSARFKDEIESRHGRRVRRGRCGRPKRKN